MENKGLIMDIKRFAVHDGDGIRTTVFLKGCPLRCVWCHNPEGLSQKPSYSFIGHKCISCGECVRVCERGVHSFSDGKHIIDRSKCAFCGKCEDACLGDAIKIYGKAMTVDELMPLLWEDKMFYDTSGGGVTVSGGECLLQADFCAELLKKLKENGISTAVDTCGDVPRESFDKVIPFTDVFLYDVKAFSEETHIKATGAGNRRITENLFYLDSLNCKIEVRIPLVPEYNLSEIPQMASLLGKLKNLVGVRILPYHNLAGSKYDAIGMYNHILPKELPTNEQIKWAENEMRKYSITVK